jgi:hypothetical protein
VNRLRTQQRLWSVHSRKRGTGRGPGPPVHDDLVRRGFGAAAPNELWLTDITEHPTTGGKLYLCAVTGACTNRIVGYSIGARMTSDLAVAALRHAVALPGPVGTVVHPDRGSRFRSHGYVHTLRGHRLRGSMGRAGACADNAAMESFSALLQKNVLNRRRWQTREQLRLAIVVWIERTHHRRRRQDTPRSAHTHRVRDTGRSRGLTALTRTSQRKSGQSRDPRRALARRAQARLGWLGGGSRHLDAERPQAGPEDPEPHPGCQAPAARLRALGRVGDHRHR